MCGGGGAGREGGALKVKCCREGNAQATLQTQISLPLTNSLIRGCQICNSARKFLTYITILKSAR